MNVMNPIFSLWNWLLAFLALNSKPILQITVLPGLSFILVFAIFTVWFERKFLAAAMLKVGPYYCGKRSGIPCRPASREISWPGFNKRAWTMWSWPRTFRHPIALMSTLECVYSPCCPVARIYSLWCIPTNR